MADAHIDTAPDPEAAADLAEFVRELGRLRVWAGNQPYRQLAKSVGSRMNPPRNVPYRTVASMFQPERRRLDLDLVVAIVRALGLPEPDVARWRAACNRVHAESGLAKPAKASRHLPADTRRFIGRATELDRLLNSSDETEGAVSPAVVITSIDGMAGVGKSALAIRAAHLLADRYPDGQLFLDLHGHTPGLAPREPADALATLLTALNVAPDKIPAGLEARAAAYRNRLAGTRTMIVLDNAATETQVKLLIPGAGGCLVLITSRKRLKSLDEAHTIALDVLSNTDAVALLQAILEPTLAPAEDPGWQELADLCGNLPLALRIAAALIRHRPAWTLDNLAVRLRAARTELRSFTDGERDLSTVFGLSYQTLTDPQRLLLRRLGLVPGPDIDRYAAAALLVTDPARADQLLQDLVDHHLLTEPAPDHYRMHDLIRGYAYAQSAALDPEHERECALDRLLRYYAHTARSLSRSVSVQPRIEPDTPEPTHAPDLRDPATALAWLRAEYTNLNDAAMYAHVRRLHSHTVALAAALADIVDIDGPWTRGLNVHQCAADAAELLGEPTAHAIALTDLGRMRCMTEDYPGAEEALTRALEIFRTLGHRIGEAIALTGLGRVWSNTGDYTRAENSLGESLEIYRTIGHRHGEASALDDLGRVHSLTGGQQNAVDAFTLALEIYRELGHRGGEASALSRLGHSRSLIGDFRGAQEALTAALEICRLVGDRRGEASALHNVGRILSVVADFPAAIDAFTRAQAAYHALGLRRGEAASLADLGRMRSVTGDLSGAEEALNQALAVHRTLSQPDGEATILTELGQVWKKTGNHSEARDALERALEIFRTIKRLPGEAYALTALGHVYSLTGDHPAAECSLTRALEIYSEIGEHGNVAWAMNHYAAAVASAGDQPRSLALYQQAQAMNQKFHKFDDEAISWEGIGDHHLAAGDIDQGTVHLRRALELYERLGMTDDAQRVTPRLADLANAQPRGPSLTVSTEPGSTCATNAEGISACR
ncbi:tetratricopeptide repeat protein [Actinospica durhamensis]|uniref:Tetratricopeptide repeat protein n=1 Tax=Actinospica durhamensis TaxID=1508375 RepID=A0A941EU44_9ACTN|nr:tetratricopeptide repeat protein [Actinospica durhamensis]MBR7836437.1 tetratricopeptide repeat protein [Actinospica durhamensis]